jgi:hypothetical protein
MTRLQILLVGLAATAALANLPELAGAQPAACTIQGDAQMPKDLEIYDAAQSGRAIARFSGGTSALAVTELPAGSSGQARIESGTGAGSFRIAGFIEAAKIPLFTGRQVAVKAGHLWIGKHRKVTLLGASGSNLRVKKSLSEPISQSFTATAACSAFTLEERTPPTWQVPGHARGYVVKKEQVELFDDAVSGGLVTVLKRSAGSEGVLLWSSERKGGWVRVEYHGEIVLDAWARASDLQALPPGETMDEVKRPATRRNPPQLALAEQPQLVKTTKDVPLRDAAGEGGKVIGKIEPGTETYVLDTVAGWASVLPKSLHVLPVSDGQFWVKASELGP